MKKNIKKIIFTVALMCGICATSQISYAKSSGTLNVANKSIPITSSISKKSASGHTGNDGSITVTVKATYVYAINGHQKDPVTKTDKSASSIAAVGFSAPSNGVSLTIASTHYASYSGATATGHTSDSY